MGDTNRHISYFKVENFKRFETFEMKDLGQFNLIVGDNNVGKTSILEALLVDVELFKLMNNLVGALNFRRLKRNYKYQDLELYFNKEKALNNKNKVLSILFKWTNCSNQDEDFVEMKIDKTTGQFVVSRKVERPNKADWSLHDELPYDSDYNLPFIPFYKGHDADLTNFYSRLQQDRIVKGDFIKSLKILIPQLENIELSSPYPGESPHLIIYQSHLRSSLPLAVFGDGVLKLFRLLAEIIVNKGSRLMIDEIDTGIHFSRFRDFWCVILKAANENDVQLFMTTHNEECIRYFKEVLEKDLPELQAKSRSITLIENEKKDVIAFTYLFEQFEANIEVGNEIRGGAR